MRFIFTLSHLSFFFLKTKRSSRKTFNQVKNCQNLTSKLLPIIWMWDWKVCLLSLMKTWVVPLNLAKAIGWSRMMSCIYNFKRCVKPTRGLRFARVTSLWTLWLRMRFRKRFFSKDSRKKTQGLIFQEQMSTVWCPTRKSSWAVLSIIDK